MAAFVTGHHTEPLPPREKKEKPINVVPPQMENSEQKALNQLDQKRHELKLKYELMYAHDPKLLQEKVQGISSLKIKKLEEEISACSVKADLGYLQHVSEDIARGLGFCMDKVFKTDGECQKALPENPDFLTSLIQEFIPFSHFFGSRGRMIHELGRTVFHAKSKKRKVEDQQVEEQPSKKAKEDVPPPEQKSNVK